MKVPMRSRTGLVLLLSAPALLLATSPVRPPGPGSMDDTVHRTGITDVWEANDMAKWGLSGSDEDSTADMNDVWEANDMAKWKTDGSGSGMDESGMAEMMEVDRATREYSAQGDCLATRVETCCGQIGELRNEIMSIFDKFSARLDSMEQSELPRLAGLATDLRNDLDSFSEETGERLDLIEGERFSEIMEDITNLGEEVDTLQGEIDANEEGIKTAGTKIEENGDAIEAVEESIQALQEENDTILDSVNDNIKRINENAGKLGEAGVQPYCSNLIEGDGFTTLNELNPADRLEGTIHPVKCKKGYSAPIEIIYKCTKGSEGNYVWTSPSLPRKCNAVTCPKNTTGKYVTGKNTDCKANEGYVIGSVTWNVILNRWLGFATAVRCPANTTGVYRTGDASKDCKSVKGYSNGTVKWDKAKNAFVGVAAKLSCNATFPRSKSGDGAQTTTVRKFGDKGSVPCTTSYKGHVDWTCSATLKVVPRGNPIEYNVEWKRDVATSSPKCSRLYCPAAVAANSSLKHSSKAVTSISTREVNDLATAPCNTGYSGGVKYKCTTNEPQLKTDVANADARTAIWRKDSGSCIIKKCPTSISASSSQHHKALSGITDANRTYGKTVKATCSTGYGASVTNGGGINYKCGSTSKWAKTSSPGCTFCCKDKNAAISRGTCKSQTSKTNCAKQQLNLGFTKLALCQWVCK